MSDNLKVLHVLPTLKKDGAEVQFANLLLEIKNTEIDIFTFDLYEKGDSIRPMLKNNNIFFKNSVFYLKKIIDKNNYDIVHSHLPKADLLVGLLSVFNKKFKHIVSVHAKYGTRKEESKIKYLFSNFFWKKILNNTSGVIAISKSIYDQFVFLQLTNHKLILILLLLLKNYSKFFSKKSLKISTLFCFLLF